MVESLTPADRTAPIALTAHARRRMQQRGIPEEVLCVLLETGRQCHDHHGCLVVHFDKRSRAELREKVPGKAYGRLERWLSTYAVVDAGGAVITAGWRTRRLVRN